jgi:hypothetical protein
MSRPSHLRSTEIMIRNSQELEYCCVQMPALSFFLPLSLYIYIEKERAGRDRGEDRQQPSMSDHRQTLVSSALICPRGGQHVHSAYANIRSFCSIIKPFSIFLTVVKQPLRLSVPLNAWQIPDPWKTLFFTC